MRRIPIALFSIFLSILIIGLFAAVAIPMGQSALFEADGMVANAIGIGLLVVLLVAIVVLPLFFYRRLSKLTNADKSDAAEKSAHPLVALIGLVIVCVAILGFFTLISSNINANIPFLLGSNVVYALVIYAVLFSVLGKRQSTILQAGSYIVILICLMFGNLLAADRNLQQQEEQQMVARIRSNLESMTESMNGEDLVLSPLPAPPESDNPDSDASVLENWMNGYLNRAIANQNDYVAELEVMEFFTLLDGIRIKQDKNLAESAVIINGAYALIDKYEQLNEDLVFGVPDEVMALSISEATKQEFVVGLEQGLERGLENARRIWDLERLMIEEYKNTLKLVSTTDSDWEMEDGLFSFYNEDTLQKFNEYMENIDALSHQQVLLREASLEREL
ncbi:MAG: hypothetical protein GKR91_19505 [Pseudomonadales bacterium]|nr:hypothetical protein [Pseudomonadales bacterium]